MKKKKKKGCQEEQIKNHSQTRPVRWVIRIKDWAYVVNGDGQRHYEEKENFFL